MVEKNSNALKRRCLFNIVLKRKHFTNADKMQVLMVKCCHAVIIYDLVTLYGAIKVLQYKLKQFRPMSEIILSAYLASISICKNNGYIDINSETHQPLLIDVWRPQ